MKYSTWLIKAMMLEIWNWNITHKASTQAVALTNIIVNIRTDIYQTENILVYRKWPDNGNRIPQIFGLRFLGKEMEYIENDPQETIKELFLEMENKYNEDHKEKVLKYIEESCSSKKT